MEKLVVKEVLYSCGKNDIKCAADSTKKVTGMFPAGLQYSAHRPSTARRAAKASGIAVVLDALLVDKTCNFLESTTDPEKTSVYAEFTYDGKNYSCTFDGTDVSYVDSAPSGYGALFPIVGYALSAASEVEEFKERFANAVEEYNTEGALSNKALAGLCDSFYYEAALKQITEEASVYEEDLAAETIKQGYVSGHFDEIDLFDDLDLPPLKILEGVEKRTKKKKGAASKSKSVDEEFESWMNGDYHIPYEWDEEAKMNIPPKDVLNDFVPNDVVRALIKKCYLRAGKIIDRLEMGKTGLEAIGNDYINCRIVGKPGTGKTTLLTALGAILGVPVYTVPITKNTEEDTFQGMTKVVEGNFSFVSTDFLKAYKNGGIVVLEEGNLADPSVMMGALGQALEKPFILNEDGYKTVHRHPLFMCFLTMNVNTYGSRDLNEALASRFRQTFMLDDPTKEEFISILLKHNSNAKLCNWIYDSYQKILNYLVSPSVNMEELCLNVTVRGCIGALECIEEETAPKQALMQTLVGAIGAKELELARDIERNVINSLPNISV